MPVSGARASGRIANVGMAERSRNFTMGLLASFTKVGVVCYGGGLLSLSALRKELVDKGVLSKKAFEDGLSLSNAVPGFVLSNLAVFAGIRAAGVLAAGVAVIGAVLPTSVMMAVATHFFLEFREVPAIRSALQAVQPVTLGMLVAMVIKLAPRSLASLNQVGIATAASVAILVFDVHPSILLATVASSSLLLSWVQPGTRPKLVHEPPGTVYLAVKRLPRLSDVSARCHVFVAIDSASCWISLGVERSNTSAAAVGFVRHLMERAPFKVTTVIIGKRAPFASAAGRDFKAAGGFAGACRSMGINLCVVGHDAAPPHSGIEQFSRRLKQVIMRQHLQSFAMARQSLRRYARLHNEYLPQKAPLAGTPAETLRHWKVVRPQIFVKQPGQLVPMME